MKLKFTPDLASPADAMDAKIVIPEDADWLNEIHPTSSGFKKIAQRIYEVVVP